MRSTRLVMILVTALMLSLLAAACSSSETVAPEPTPDFAALIQNAMSSQPAGATPEDVASAVQSALAAQPGVTEAQVANTIARALEAQPGVTEAQVADAIAGALAERPGVTEGQMASAIAEALTQQTPGLTEAEVSEAIGRALADRPGVTQADIEAAVQSAVAMAIPTPAMVETDMMGMDDRYGGILMYGLAPNVEHLFHLTYSGGACAAWCMTVGDPLTAYGPDSEWRPEKSIAESFSMSEDKKTITFDLKPGILFHDGTEVNADSVKFSLEFVLDENNGAVTRPAIQAIENVEVIDNLTVAITTSDVFAPIITNLGMTAGMPVSPTAFNERGKDDLEANGTVSTGPFMVDEWVSGSHIDYVKFEDYHRDGLPYLDGWRWVVIPDDQVRAAALQSDNIHLAGISQSALDAIAASRSVPGIQEFKGFAGPRMDHFNAARAPFDDIRVRQAAQMAMDRHAWNQAMSGGEGFPYRGSLVPPAHAASFQVPEDEYPFAYNPEKAKELLEEYAAEKGISLPISMMSAFTCTEEQKALGCHDLPEQPITITTSSSANNIRRAEISKAYYEAVGFKVEMDIGGGDEAKRTFVTKEASFSLRGFGLRPHPSGTFNSYLGYGGYWNNGGYGTSDAQIEIDRLVKKAAQTFDPADQNYLYQQAQRLYMENVLGGVRTAANPSYHFVQSSVMWAEFPDAKWVKYPSDASVKIHDVWLEQ
ncbi:MAG: hypothetical protein J4G14_07875 [Dehalococcoidia bacterium]|nr:hypothetical protein [Dehalococcoidia bacterium]